MICNYCKNPCIKKGKRKNGTQKFRCCACRKYQQDSYKNKAWLPHTNSLILRCVKQSSGIRGISSIVEISATTVLKRIKSLADKVERPPIILYREYEMDELKTYVKNKKNEQWIIYAIDKRTRQVVDFRIGRRNKTNLRAVVDTLVFSRAKRIFTDRLLLYKNLIPNTQHKAVPHTTNYIERMNLNIRTHIKRLSRKTICFSKSAAVLAAILKLYFWT